MNKGDAEVVGGYLQSATNVMELATLAYDKSVTAFQQQAAGSIALVSIANSLLAIATMMYAKGGCEDGQS